MAEKEKIERLKSIRAGDRGVVTRHINEAKTILENRRELGHVEEELTVAQVDRLNVISLLLLEKQKTLSKIDQEVLELCELTEIECEIQESENIVSKILETKQQIEEVQKEVQVETEVNRTSNALETRSDRSSVNERRTFATPRQVKPKLPKLVLPKFRGDITTFSTFIDSFESAIDKNPELSVIDKFNYLSSSVEGPAARAIQGLTLSEANYVAAKEILKQRYGRPQQVIAAHMDELLKIPSCIGEKSSQLRYVYDKVSIHVRGLESLGVTAEQYGSMLIPVVMSKLPTEIRVQIARLTSSEVWSIREMLELIRKEVEAREASEHVKLNNEKKTAQSYLSDTNRNLSSKPSTASALLLRSSNRPTEIRCVYCKNSHYSSACDKVTDVNERKTFYVVIGDVFYVSKLIIVSRSAEIIEVVANVLDDIISRFAYDRHKKIMK